MSLYEFSHTSDGVAVFIAFQLKSYISRNQGKCAVILAPCDVQLDMDDKTIIQPDVMVVCDRDKIGKLIYGAPDFVVEVLSPSTKILDGTIKFDKYTKAGVKEYWLVDPEKQKIVKYDLTKDFDVSIYGFNDKVPVSIYGGKCTVDFSPILEEIKDLLHK